ncbi:uncharacterized protein si:dkey-33c12.4 [Salmo trutta]|uniref:uncharacterized protein si:dkey-33c12.4 n=1 Tax=Salmo trutta TaxID=8032 RepID=UPI0011328EBE|nr:uncharacterized protein LOC115173042 [Salmo trutta]
MSHFRKRDWKPDHVIMQENPHILHTHEAMVDLINGRPTKHTFMESFNYGLLGLDFVNPFMNDFIDDEYDDDNDYYDDKKHKDKKAYCGFTHNFLGHGISKLPLTPHPCIRQLTPEEAEKNARELIEEENKLKEKAEKKRLKKKRQKERKRAGKDKEPENRGPGRSGRSENQGGDLNIEREQQQEQEEEEEEEERLGPGPGGTTARSRQQEVQDSPLEETCGSSNEDQEDVRDEGLARETEELDMRSCFVSTAACIAKRQLEQNPKPEKKIIIQQQQEPVVKRQQQQEEEEQGEEWQEEEQQEEEQQQEAIVRKKEKKVEANVDDILKRSTELALIGNQFAACGQFDMAVKYFTDAIKHNPTEFKLFGNRSFCYEKMQQYDRALCDAELALSMEPGWIKGLYRKGKALSGLKRYFEACQTYKEVLKQDSLCSDAAQELMKVQIMQLMEMGFTREQSSNALIAHGDFEKALNVLSGIEDEYGSNDLPVAATSAEDSATWEGVGPRPKPLLQTRPKPRSTTPGPKPRSPIPGPVHHDAPGGSTSNLFPVYVGCLGPNTTQPMLHSLFSSAGTIHSIKILRSSNCAFINYTNMDHCERAIRTLHGEVLNGVMLAVRHPDRVMQKKLGLSQLAFTLTNAPEKSQECYFWRTTGCVRYNTCIFRHVPQHKGIDRDKVNK